MDADVWKTTRIAVNRSTPGPVHIRLGLSSKLKCFRTAVNLTCEMLSDLIGIR